LHFWVGSFCGVLDDGGGNKPAFPTGVIAAADVMTLIEDIGNQIPAKSWMLYLFELFNKQNIVIELNLICQFDNQDYFEAILMVSMVDYYKKKEPTLLLQINSLSYRHPILRLS
jgi:hypothetical protein